MGPARLPFPRAEVGASGQQVDDDPRKGKPRRGSFSGPGASKPDWSARGGPESLTPVLFAGGLDQTLNNCSINSTHSGKRDKIATHGQAWSQLTRAWRTCSEPAIPQARSRAGPTFPDSFHCSPACGAVPTHSVTEGSKPPLWGREAACPVLQHWGGR